MENTDNNNKELTKKLCCKLCNYQTDITGNWVKHLATEKHMRNGNKKSTKCDLCDYESISHWNIKIHKKTAHMSQEDREKSKYYCKICDVVSLCPAYYNKHINGKHHKNKIFINDTLKEIDEMYAKKCNINNNRPLDDNTTNDI